MINLRKGSKTRYGCRLRRIGCNNLIMLRQVLEKIWCFLSSRSMHWNEKSVRWNWMVDDVDGIGKLKGMGNSAWQLWLMKCSLIWGKRKVEVGFIFVGFSRRADHKGDQLRGERCFTQKLNPKWQICSAMSGTPACCRRMMFGTECGKTRAVRKALVWMTSRRLKVELQALARIIAP